MKPLVWIGYTLQSAVAQTWPHKEIIVVDDGSTDETAEVAGPSHRDKWRSFIQTTRAAAARNHAMSISQGDFVQRLDANDLRALDRIERQLAALHDSDGERILPSGPSAYFSIGRGLPSS